MSKMIHKYTLGCYEGTQDISMPAGAKFLNLAKQDDVLCLWVMVDPSARYTTYRFNMFFTRMPLPDNPGRYIGQVTNWGLVYHVFHVSLVEGMDGTYREV